MSRCICCQNEGFEYNLGKRDSDDVSNWNVSLCPLCMFLALKREMSISGKRHDHGCFVCGHETKSNLGPYTRSYVTLVQVSVSPLWDYGDEQDFSAFDTIMCCDSCVIDILRWRFMCGPKAPAVDPRIFE